ncbi:MAG: hypothetical protein GY765_05645 [bacterium]|nr:hypothetical protein [bacterium]
MNDFDFVNFINRFYSRNPGQNTGYTELSAKSLEGMELKISQLVDNGV